MRLAPAPLFFADDPREAIFQSAQSSRTTHGAWECIDACRFLGALIVGAVEGRSKSELLSPHFTPAADEWTRLSLSPKIAEIAAGSFRLKEPPEIVGGGYVVESLEAALWAFHKTDSFRDGALLAVNLGDDADTTGAVYGQIAGAYYGQEGIPSEWLEKLAMREAIEKLADSLCDIVESRLSLVEA